jgi:hypothetical protein
MSKPTYVDFDMKRYQQLYDPKTDYRNNPGYYRIGKGQQGVLICQPYKSEIGPHWRFKTPELAHKSATKIYSMFLEYLNNDEFVGADLAKKYLHMGFTRARRYANHPSGTKWAQTPNGEWYILPQDVHWDSNDKAVSAEIFKIHWELARNNKKYLSMKKDHRKKYVYHSVRTEYEIRKNIQRERGR